MAPAITAAVANKKALVVTVALVLIIIATMLTGDRLISQDSIPTSFTAAEKDSTARIALSRTNTVRSVHRTALPTETMSSACPPINPGCISRQITDYKPVDTGVEYQHPSLIQYAKLAKLLYKTPVQLTFMDYMALMSAYKFLKPEKIIIHTYTEITGKYWDAIQTWNTSIVAVKHQRVVMLGSRVVPRNLITHQADFIKLRGLLEYGGTISDFDVIVVNGTKWKQMEKSSECVLSGRGHFINAGFNSCVKNSSFVRKWLNGYYTDYRSTGWLYNASRKPRDILEQGSATASCFNVWVVEGIATNPTWSHYQEWLEEGGVHWRGKVAAHYFNGDLEKWNETHLHANNSLGELLRHVMDS